MAMVRRDLINIQVGLNSKNVRTAKTETRYLRRKAKPNRTGEPV
jgi:hypothetical protein